MIKNDEERLVKRAIRGNVDAYGELMEKYKEYLYRTAYVYTRNETDALDVVSECILKGFKSIRKMKKPEYFKTWLTKILINSANDLNAAKNGVNLMDLDEAASIEAPSQGISQEEKMDLYSAIECLSEKYKTVIVLKYFSDLKNSEISEVMGIPEGSVSAYLTRAKNELRSYLKEDYQFA